jgi:phosphinothricin acetyltransferase
VIGYAYANAYRPRAAYRFTIEDSIYVDAAEVGRGCGQALLAKLIARCEQGPWRQMIAVIGDGTNAASVRLHERVGFREVGRLDSVGFKFDRWIDSVLMQRALGAQADGPA